MSLIQTFLDLFFHMDKHLSEWMGMFGLGTYAILFIIIFAETGFVVTPFLPGDSLLFAAGTLTTLDNSPLRLHWLILLLSAAAVIGDAVNFSAGFVIGPKVFYKEDSWLLNKKHLWRAQRFYERHGGKTIILARFIPIIRTFAPFVAGIGKMKYRRFAAFNVIGGIAWVTLFSWAGWRFAQAEIVKKQFHYVIIAIVVISVMPAVIEYFRHRNEPEEIPPPPTAAE